MRKAFTKLMIIGLVLTMASCTSNDDGDKMGDPSLSLDKTEISITDPVDTTITVKLQSNVEWVALVAADAASWVSVTPENGPASADLQSINITLKANETIKGRSTRISFAAKSGGKAIDLDLSQSQKLSLLGRDSMALLDLYNATNGWKWKIVWPVEDGAPLATWYGVTIGAVGGDLRVTKLDMQDRNANGTLPESLQTLTELTNLVFARNRGLVGPLPEWLPKLTKLREFIIAETGITGTIPESYWDMTDLRQLDVSANEITGPLSPKVGQMVNLEELDLEGCPIGGSLPKEVGDMAGLLAVNIKGCKFTGEIPKELEKLSKCTHLHLDENLFTGGIPEFDGPILQSLTSMQISGCEQMDGPLPKALGKCPKLWELIVSYTGTTGVFPTEYSDCPLEQVQAYSTKLSGELPRWESHKTLSAFVADSSNFSGTLPEWTSTCAVVIIKGNNLEGGLPEGMFKSTATNKELSIAGNSKMGGVIPSSFWLNKSRIDFDATDLAFSGEFPSNSDIEAQALNIRNIKIENNKFSGTLPEALFTLTHLQSALLAGNNFTGTLPSSPALNTELAQFSVSGNKLTGEFPQGIKGHNNWAAHMWNPAVKICPQQAGFGFTGDTCTKDLPAAQ